MTDVNQLITERLDIWTSAIEKKSGAGRGNGGAVSLHGIKKLRKLVLELAVRGRLVPQDEEEGSASTLLDRLEAALTARVSAGDFKKPKQPLPFDEETLSLLPQNWARARFGQIVRVINGRAYKKNELLDSGTPVLRVGNLFTVNDWYYSDLELETDKYIDDGDLIYAWSASFGPFIWQGGKVIYHYHIWKLEPFDDELVSKEFLKLFLDQQTASIKASGHGIAMLHMTKERMEQLELHLPPLAEQYRIVAKVDELMGLCDALEALTEESLKAHRTLVETCLTTLTNSQNPEELAENWARLETNFDNLFTTEESVTALEWAIYELAIKGVLVEQRDEEEPAAAFLKRNNPKWRADGNVRALPSGWAACPLGDLGDVTGGGTPSKSNKSFWGGDIPWVSPKDMKVNCIRQAIDNITEDAIAGSSAKLINPGSLLVVVRGMILAHSFPVAITEVPVAVNQDMKAFELGDFDRTYVLFMMKGLKREVLSRVERSTHGTCKLVSEKLWSVELPIPPRPEQTRIVNKVETLVQICSNLRDQIRLSGINTRSFAEAVTANIH